MFKNKNMYSLYNLLIENENRSYTELFADTSKDCLASNFIDEYLELEGIENENQFYEVSFVGSIYLDFLEIFNWIEEEYPDDVEVQKLNDKFKEEATKFRDWYFMLFEENSDFKNLLKEILEQNIGCYEEINLKTIYEILDKIKKIDRIFSSYREKSFYKNAAFNLEEIYKKINSGDEETIDDIEDTKKIKQKVTPQSINIKSLLEKIPDENFRKNITAMHTALEQLDPILKNDNIISSFIKDLNID